MKLRESIFCLLFNIIFGPASSDSLTNDENSKVLAITALGDRIAVARIDVIYVYDLQESASNVSIISSISLEDDDVSSFLELKLLSREKLVYCLNKSCRLCTLRVYGWFCSMLELLIDGVKPKELLYVAASSSDGKLALRIVDDKQTTAIIRYRMNDKELTTAQIAKDPPYDKQKTFASFSRGSYTYFVGSSDQPYDPARNSLVTSKKFTMPKITRICSLDESLELVSRMDLALSCDGNSEDGSEDFQVEAAHYDRYSELLTVAFRKTMYTHVVCQYGLRQIEKQFQKDWDICQRTTISQWIDCAYPKDVTKEKEHHCFIFTRRYQKGTIQTCFKSEKGKRRYENCDLHTSKDNSYGWLEDFKPLEGRVIARFTNQSTSTSIRNAIPDADNKALFISLDHGEYTEILRIQTSDGALSESRVIWKTKTTSSSRQSFVIAKDSLHFINGTTISTVPIQCQQLYPTCESIAEGGWLDPLSCVWCPDADVNRAISLDQTIECKQPLKTFCPPKLSHAWRRGQEWMVIGEKLNRLGSPQISICGEPCILNSKKSSDTKLHCSMGYGAVIAGSCKINLVGKLDHYDSFLLTILEGSAMDFGKELELWKIAILAVLVCLIAILASRMMFITEKNEKSQSRESHLPIANLPNRHVPLVSVDGIKTINNTSYLYFQNVGKPTTAKQQGNYYEQIFHEIDPRLKIDYRRLQLGKEIGCGSFGIVCSAVYATEEGERKVACKTLHGATGVREFFAEGLLMSRFDHRRIMPLIGIAFTISKIPIIVTDYMQNRDLAKYIKNTKNEITLHDLLNFAREIAEGMEYLHSKNFVHRDLAARNCMLDDNLHVKIADFGLCRECDDNHAYTFQNDRGLPLPWIALEIFSTKKFTFEGDVWAYGVVLWELTTKGLFPYADCTNQPIEKYLSEGNRLPRPHSCPSYLYHNVMLPCWEVDMKKRPTFKELGTMVQNLCTSPESSGRQLQNSYLKEPRTELHFHCDSNENPTVAFSGFRVLMMMISGQLRQQVKFVTPCALPAPDPCSREPATERILEILPALLPSPVHRLMLPPPPPALKRTTSGIGSNKQ